MSCHSSKTLLRAAHLTRLRSAAQHQGDAPDLPDEVSVASSEAGTESPTASRGNALRSQSAEMLGVADALANVAEVLSPKQAPHRFNALGLAAHQPSFFN